MEHEALTESFAVMYLGSGIGLGLYVNGALIEGSQGSASEFGHMLWQDDGVLCRCGRQGCIVAYASDFGIYRTANEHLKNTAPKDITPSQKEMEELAMAARKGDKAGLAAFNLAGKAIGDGLSNLVMLVNPRDILITGPGVAHFDLLKSSIDKALYHATRNGCLLYTSPSPRDRQKSRMPSSA